jgi:hypothetical protein
METIIPEDETIKYINKIKLEDIFPTSINSIYKEINSKDENDSKTKQEKDDEIADIEMNDTQNIPNFILSKDVKEKIQLDPIYKINAISSFNNILLIGANNELKLYDISDNYELYGTVKTPDNKNILCIACTEINNIIYCLIGGEFSSILVIDVLSIEELTGYQLIGHKNKVYEIEFHPYKKNVILSASKDCTVRLWNFKGPELLVIFGGPHSFESDVLCIDWDSKGEYFIGGGVDCIVRIYQIDEVMNNLINSSMNKQKVKTLLKAVPYYSCGGIHDNLIDCIKYNNKFIISKSVDGIIKEWLPFKDINGENSFFLINIFVYKTKQLIFGIKFCFEENNIIIGNEMGQIFLFNKEKTEMSKGVCEHPFFQNNPSQIINVDEEKPNNILLKCCHYNSFYNLFLIGGNKGEVYIYNLLKK